MIDRMVEVGANSGLEFRFDRIRPGNTFDAHRLLCWAHEHGDQDRLKERLFRANITEGLSVADHSVLAMCAEESGLDGDAARTVLAGDAYAGQVRQEEQQAQQLGVRGVPFFVMGKRFALSGAQPPEQIRSAIERALLELPAEEQEEAASGASCSTTDCNV
jgi:predicted DsbA family dithiol-disulfide isomerase